MILPMLLAVQLAPIGQTAPIDLSATRRCRPEGTGDDVVVCGSPDQERYRLRPLPPRYVQPREGMPQAEVPLGGGTLGVTTQQGNVGGVATNRAMLSWKLKF